MVNGIDITIKGLDGEDVDIAIEAEYSDPCGYGIEHAPLYSIWLFDEIDGTIARDGWVYDGQLSAYEANQIIEFLKGYKHSDPI